MYKCTFSAFGQVARLSVVDCIPNVLKGLVKSIPRSESGDNVCKRYIVVVGQYDTFLIRYRIDFTSTWVAKCKFVPTFNEKSGCL